MEIKLDIVLKQELKARDLTVTKLAKECAIPKTTLTDWTNGVTPSARTIHHLYGLAEFLNVSLSRLLFNVAETGSSVEEEIIMSTVFRDDGANYRITISKLDRIGKLNNLVK